MTILLPIALDSPFPLSLHPSWEVAHEQSLLWACDQQLVERSSAKHDYLCKARFAWLSAATHPDLVEADLILAAQFMVWYFTYDDPYVNPTAPENLSRLLAVQERLFAVLHGAGSRRDDPSVVRALDDIYQTMCRYRGAQDTWLQRFCRDLEGFLEANRWVLHQRLQRRVPDLATYLNLRQYDVGLFPCLDMAAFFRHLNPDATFFHTSYFQALNRMAATHCFMVNDILGVEREIRDQDATNFVLMVQHEFDLDLAAALEWSIQRCNRELASFLALEAALPSLGVTVNTDARAYLRYCHAWTSGQIGWYSVSGRYTDAVLGLGD